MTLQDLIEAPMIIDFSVSAAEKRLKELTKEWSDNLFVSSSESDIFYKQDTWFNTIFLHINNNTKLPDAFIEFTQKNIKLYENKIIKVFAQGTTYKRPGTNVSWTEKGFKLMANLEKCPILTDDKNSQEMQNVFIKWISNPEKYGIVDFAVWDSKKQKMLLDGSELETDVWDSLPTSKRYSLLFDFHKILNEREERITIKVPSHLFFKS